MSKLSSVVAGVIGGAFLFEASSAVADVNTLLYLDNPPNQTQTSYDLGFTATASTTTISFAGNQRPAVEFVYDINVTQSGGANLLGSTWTYTPAPPGGLARTLADGTDVPALEFYGVYANYDTYSQSFATTVGTEYLLKFDFTNIAGPQRSGALLVTTTALALPSVPEPSTWAMMLTGLAGLGLTARRRRARLGRSVREPQAMFR